MKSAPTTVFVCDTCEHMKAARDSGKDSCGQECTGPLRGDVYPRHKGPLEGARHLFCFMCGQVADAVLRVRKGETESGMLGICNAHKGALARFAKDSLGEGAVRHVFPTEGAHDLDGSRCDGSSSGTEGI